MTITERSKRTHSRLSSHEHLPLQQQEEPRQYKPRTSVLRRTHKSQASTPAQFLTDAPVLTEGNQRRVSSQNGSRKESLRRSSYLPRKILAKEMMEYYLNNVFKKVSMIRTDEKKGIVEKRKQRAKSTFVIL